MNKAQAHEIAKKAALEVYKATLDKLAQVVPGTTDAVQTLTPTGEEYAGHVANTGGENVTPAANHSFKHPLANSPEELDAINKFIDAFTKVHGRKPTDKEVKDAYLAAFGAFQTRQKVAAKFATRLAK